MEKYRIKGGHRLYGEVEISGAKNAVLPILAASVITKGENIFSACPEISDVDSMLRILRSLGCEVNREDGMISVDASDISKWKIPDDLMKEMRSSVFLAGSLLSRFGEAVISNPGGCNIGARPIDIHINGLKQMGAHIERLKDIIVIKAENLKPSRIKLEYPSVGATENLLLAAVSVEGKTVIENSAREPEITDLQNYINSCGGCVRGAGTGTIEIYGGRLLRGCQYRIMPDRIETGTFLLMAAACGGEIMLKHTEMKNVKALVDILTAGGYEIRKCGENLLLKSSGKEQICEKIATHPYPGFPTDLHPQMVALLTQRGVGSTVEENIFENRMGYAKQLIKMGADIEISGKKVIINNNNILYGSQVYAEDLRGGAALVIAGLSAEGVTCVHNTKYIKRGYGGFKEKISLLGGEIREDEQG